ncbi:phage baseplate upper protein [Enterococcus cecorum]|uniref:phage baseplate upper protein n=1 Tax=Enterococcus cecorum TaxID=44008 RepID=UPI00200B22A7|nr:phage baseplate upper protein [Enterococcus cecorum]
MATLAKMVTKTLDVGVSNTTIDLSATIKSFDVMDTKFIFGITSNQGLAINLSGATVKYIVEYYVEGKTYAIEGNCLVVDINTISFNLPNQLRGYNGKALIGIYATLTDGTKIDIKNIVVNIEPSLMDKGTDFKARYYFESFDNVLASVKDAGNKAISQINTVLPGVQSKVAEIDRQIKSLPPIPDLYVAYADNANGTGFSKTDNSKLFKGYSVRNSTSPSDYRWGRNVDSLQVGGENLFQDAAFRNETLMSDSTSNYIPGHWIKYNNGDYSFGAYNNQINYVQFTSSGNRGITQFLDTETFHPGKEYCIRVFTMWESSNSTLMVNLVRKSSSGTVNWYYSRLFEGTIKASSGYSETRVKFTIPDSDDGAIYGVTIINSSGSSSDGQTVKIVKPKLEEGNIPTAWSPASEDQIINSNPINSILTTLSAENPSSTLGGTWTQLGTESKFGSTIYYWKRTN